MNYRQERIISINGEVLSERIKPSFPLWDDQRGYKLYHNRKTVNGISGLPFPKEMTKMEIANISILGRYLVGNSSMIGYRGNKNTIKPMLPGKMAEVLGISQRSVYRFIKRMMELGMMAKVEIEIEDKIHTQYYLNPLYFNDGKYIPLGCYLIFQEQIDRYIPKWAQEKYAEMQRVDNE